MTPQHLATGMVLAALAIAGCVNQSQIDDSITDDGIRVPLSGPTLSTDPTTTVSVTLDPTRDDDGDGFGLQDDFCPQESGPINGCADTNGNGIADVNETITATTSTTDDSQPDFATVEFDSQWFAAEADSVLSQLDRLDVIVIDYPVCSGSVEGGQIRQIVDSNDGAALLDENGVTEAGQKVAPGTVIEVKIGNGKPCS